MADDVILYDTVLDGGIDVLNTLANAIWICAGTPTSYADAETKTKGFKTLGAGNVFGNPADATPNGRQVTSVAITDGTVSASGTVTCWAVVDIPNTKLLAVGEFTGAGAVTAGWAWTLDAFTIRVPATAASGSFDAKTVAWSAAVVSAGGTVSDTQKGYVDELILGLTTDGLLTLCEGLWLFAGEAVAQQGRIDIVNLHAGTAVGTGLEYHEQGLHNTDNASAFDTGFSSFSHFSQNSAAMLAVQVGGFIGQFTGAADDQIIMGVSATADCLMKLNWTTPQLTSHLHTSAPHSSPAGSGTLDRGTFIVSRTSSTALAAYREGTQLDTWTNTSTALPTTSFTFLVRHDGGASYANFADHNNFISIGGLFSGLNSTQAANLSSRVNTYLAHYNIIPAVLNHVSYSQQLDNAVWTKIGVTVIANDTTAPDGTTTADLVYATASGAYAAEIRQQHMSAGAGDTYRISFYVKAKSWTWVAIRMYDGTNNSFSYFNIAAGSTGTVGASASSLSATGVGNGWYRISMVVAAVAASDPFAELFLVDGDNDPNATPSGTNGVWLWGAQVVQGSTEKTYSRRWA